MFWTFRHILLVYLLVRVSRGKHAPQAEVTVRVGSVVAQTEAERTVPEQPAPPAVHLADTQARLLVTQNTSVLVLNPVVASLRYQRILVFKTGC